MYAMNVYAVLHIFVMTESSSLQLVLNLCLYVTISCKITYLSMCINLKFWSLSHRGLTVLSFLPILESDTTPKVFTVFTAFREFTPCSPISRIFVIEKCSIGILFITWFTIMLKHCVVTVVVSDV